LYNYKIGDKVKRLSIISLITLFVINNVPVFPQWKGETKTENGILVVKNPEEGLWEGKRNIKFEKVLTIGNEEENYLAMPWGITTDSSQNIYIADFMEGCIKVYNSSKRFLKTISKKGQGPGEVHQFLQDIIACLPANKICFGDEWGSNTEIEIFDLGGKYCNNIKIKTDSRTIAVSKQGDKFFIGRRIRTLFGEDYLKESGMDLTYAVFSYDFKGNLLKKLCKFEDIGKVGDQKYYPESTYITTLSNGDIAVAFEYPYVIKIFSPEGVQKMRITRNNHLFKSIKLERSNDLEHRKLTRSLFRYKKTAEVKKILDLPENMFMVVILDHDHGTKEKGVYDFYNYDGYFLQSFRGNIGFDYADIEGFLYDIAYQNDIPLVNKYKVHISE